MAHGRFLEVVQKQKTERERERKKEKKRRLSDGNNNGQAMHGARKHAWRTQAAWSKILGKTNFHTQEFPRSGSKAKYGEKKKEED